VEEQIRPQEGPQEAFLACEADGCIFGGAAYGGKSYGLLLESTRYVSDPYYTGIIFRRKSTEITTPGGLWDTSQGVYRAANIRAEMTRHDLTAKFPSGGKIKFSHLEHEHTKLDHQGGQYCFIGFDEVTTFTRSQFFFILTRNRPAAGCKQRPYWRATCNPDCESWVRDIVDWWVDKETGYAIPERSGVIRYYTILNDEIFWVDQDWRDEDGEPPKSITFIPSYMENNPLGMLADPTYRANIRAQDKVTRERLEKGNWNISYKGGMFDPSWFDIIDTAPKMDWLRYWDLAATVVKKEGEEPDWTAGGLCGMHAGELYIKDMEHFRETPATTEGKIKKCAEVDGYNTAIGIEEEHGASGKFCTDHYQRNVLKGYEVHPDYVSGDKIDRAKPWCALAEHGHVHLVRGEWNRRFLGEVGAFPLGKKDQVDAISGAYKLLTRNKYIWEHFKMNDTQKLEIKWQEAEGRPTLHYAAMYQHKDLSLWVLQALWDNVAGKLFVYNCWTQDNPIPAIVAPTLIKKMKLKKFRHEKILCNDRMFKEEGHILSAGQVLRREFRKHQIRVNYQEAIRYEQAGAILAGTQMFALKQIYLDESCKEAARQWAGWTIDKGKPSEEDCGYCICHCMTISELRRRKLIKKVVRKPDYKNMYPKKV